MRTVSTAKSSENALRSLSGTPSSSNTRIGSGTGGLGSNERLFREPEKCYSLFSAHRRKVAEKLVKGDARGKVVNERMHRNPRPSEDWNTAHNLSVGMINLTALHTTKSFSDTSALPPCSILHNAVAR